MSLAGSGHDASLIDMANESKPASGPAPLFGPLSVVTPIVGGFILCALLLADNYVFNTGTLSVLSYVILVPLSLGAGTIFAIVALLRREQYWALAVIGLVINLPTLLYCLSLLKHNGDYHF
jgi:hypothetical protein